jgi:hypothetical protein
MVTANKPYVVTFDHAAVPDKPDHSSSSPGPSVIGADRAGYTKAILKKKLSIEWDDGPARADGTIPLISRAVNVSFALDPITVAVSSDYPANSCPYKVTLKHEIEDHARSYLKIFLSYKDTLVSRLNEIVFPTEGAPRWILPKDVESLQDSLAQEVQLIIVTVAKKLFDEMEADRKIKDSPQAYAALYAQCPAADWLMGGGQKP